MLVNWLFFWDWDGAPPASSLTPVVVTVPNFGGSGARDDPTYHPLPDEFWDIREQKLAEFAPAEPPPPSVALTVAPPLPLGPDPAALLLDQLTAERTQLAAALPDAPDVPSLKEMSHQLREYDAAIAEVGTMLRKPLT